MAKVVLITGASAGIGRACADRLHNAGWVVVGASRRGTSSGPWQGLVMDVDSDESVRAGVAEVLAPPRTNRRRGGVSGLGRGRRRRAHDHRRGQGPGRDQPLGCDACRPVRPARDAGPGRRPHRPHQLDRRRPRHPVPGLLQRQQVRTRGVGRSAGLRGGAVRDRRHPGRARQRPDRLHRQPEDGGSVDRRRRLQVARSTRRWA